MAAASRRCGPPPIATCCTGSPSGSAKAPSVADPEALAASNVRAAAALAGRCRSSTSSVSRCCAVHSSWLVLPMWSSCKECKWSKAAATTLAAAAVAVAAALARLPADRRVQIAIRGNPAPAEQAPTCLPGTRHNHGLACAVGDELKAFEPRYDERNR